MTTLTLEWALAYARRGLSVLPLEPRGPNNRGKKPLLPTWKKLQKQPLSEAELRSIYKQHPHANVGIICGTVSGVIGFDVDGPLAEAKVAELNGGPLPASTGFVSPGGGRRVFYRIPAGLVIPGWRWNCDDAESHVILLGEGRYTVMHPSIHPDGPIYPPAEGKLIDIPMSVLTWALASEDRIEKEGRGEPTNPPPSFSTYGDNLRKADHYLSKCGPCISGQNGRGLASFIAGRLIHHFGLGVDDALALVMYNYDHICQPPWGERAWRERLEWIRDKGYCSCPEHKGKRS